MTTSTLTTKGQLVIPGKIRKEAGLKKGSKVSIRRHGRKIIIEPLDISYFKSLRGVLKTKGKVMKSLKADKKIEREL